MASGGSDRLTNKDMIRLAEAIAAKHMEEIAMLYFDIDWEEVENSKKEHRDDVKAFSRDMLRKWAYKNSGPNQVQVLAGILYKAAREHSYIDPEKVKEILGVLPDDKTNNDGDKIHEATEEDIQFMARILREHYKKTMKIEMAPWAKAYTVDMKDMYTELLSQIRMRLLACATEQYRLIKYAELDPIARPGTPMYLQALLLSINSMQF